MGGSSRERGSTLVCGKTVERSAGNVWRRTFPREARRSRGGSPARMLGRHHEEAKAQEGMVDHAVLKQD
jgi:hypothetical protein